jgi:putative addiction module antidote
MNALVIKKFGNSAGVILPKELLAQLGTEVGGTLTVTRTARGIELSVSEASFDEQMIAMRQAMAQYKNALRELAK